MRMPHLLAVEVGPDRFAALVAALREAGLRAGWLDLTGGAGAPPVGPADLEAAAGAGVLRAVAASGGPEGGRTVAVKPLKGAPVLADLLREHFRGCALVLVRGAAGEDVPQLAPEGISWMVRPPGEAVRVLATADLVAALRRPRPWS